MPVEAQLSSPCPRSSADPGRPCCPARGGARSALWIIEASFRGAESQGGHPLSVSGCRPCHLLRGYLLTRGTSLVPWAWLLGTVPPTSLAGLAAPPQTVLDFVPDWLAHNPINLVGGALCWALGPAPRPTIHVLRARQATWQRGTSPPPQLRTPRCFRLNPVKGGPDRPPWGGGTGIHRDSRQVWGRPLQTRPHPPRGWGPRASLWVRGEVNAGLPGLRRGRLGPAQFWCRGL